jgi:acetate kinase
MKILVINSGSSSIKYKLFDMNHKKELASGIAERINEKNSVLNHNKISKNGDVLAYRNDDFISGHREGLNLIVELLVHEKYGVVKDKAEISAIGHRVVHGGENYKYPTIVNKSVINAIKDTIPLAPLHNPPNLIGIEIAKTIFPESVQVAVFDTAFHQTMPPKAFIYALPYELYKNEKVRRYGFHGTSHSYVSKQAGIFLGKSIDKLNLITIHLGNGASMAAIKKGICIDTTMGMTPLDGLVMGTRSGDVDPALPFYLSDHLNMSLAEIDNLLNKNSGLKGICGTNDMREVIERVNNGDSQAKLALEIYTYRIKKYIGAFIAALESVDAIVFTAGIGENSPDTRRLSCQDLKQLGIEMDPKKNAEDSDGINEINTPSSHVKILVIPTNEELHIAIETKKIMNKSN